MARTIQSLERAAAVLRLLAGGERRLGLSDIASAIGLAKATTHGLLRTLQQEGFVEQDPDSGKYLAFTPVAGPLLKKGRMHRPDTDLDYWDGEP